MVVSERIADWIRPRYFAGGLTYSGHPLACASAVASIEAFQEEGIVENAAASGEIIRAALTAMAERHPAIGEVRGLGCFFGLELVKNRETREPLVPFNSSGAAAKPVAAMVSHALSRGLYLMSHWNVVMVCPPLTITREELDEGLSLLDDALSIADEFRRLTSCTGARRAPLEAATHASPPVLTCDLHPQPRGGTPLPESSRGAHPSASAPRRSFESRPVAPKAPPQSGAGLRLSPGAPPGRWWRGRPAPKPAPRRPSRLNRLK